MTKPSGVVLIFCFNKSVNVKTDDQSAGDALDKSIIKLEAAVDFYINWKMFYMLPFSSFFN